jgi:radical SAM superfamily enzyme YgiQ (UPF0313 family)
MKFALVHFGIDESYGLMFVAQEIRKCGHDFQWFDGDAADVTDRIVEAAPDFACFGPMTLFFAAAVRIAGQVKARLPKVRTVFGGVHVTSCSEEVASVSEVDIRVDGTVYGTIPQIIAAQPGALIHGDMPNLAELMPLRQECYDAIPRIGSRHQKMLMTHFGCMYNCSYCSTSRTRERFGARNYKTFWLTRRPVEMVIKEAKSLVGSDTREIQLADDDILYGQDIEEWLPRFAEAWKAEVGLPIWGNITPNTVVKVSDRVMSVLAGLVSNLAMGVQSARPESLKLFNRQFQKTEQVKAACERLKAFGIPTKLEMIIGLPVEDPLGDAVDTIKMFQTFAQGTFVAAFPLMLFPGTSLHRWCKENNIPLNDTCDFELHRGIGSVKFDEDTRNKLKILAKLTPFFVKYNVEERWIRAFMEMEMVPEASRKFSENNYLEALLFRHGPQAAGYFDEILAKVDLQY